jgi:CelD/BcsL family acetyltransferase involved in cellulose biosynthesis
VSVLCGSPRAPPIALPGMLQTELIADPGALEPVAEQWDGLAVANAQPICSPAWLLAWWRSAAPAGAQARVIAAREGDALVGVAPFFVQQQRGHGRVDYRLMGGSLPRNSPLAVPGREWEVAKAVDEVLAASVPRPDLIALEAAPLASHWSTALRDQWPGRMHPLVRQYLSQGSPTISLHDASFDAWLARRSANFRGQMRRLQRQFAASGGTARMATAETLSADIAAFMRLHAGRWEGRGTSSIVASEGQVPAMFEEAGRAHLASHRFRLWLLEIDGQPISAQLFAEAGGEVLYLNGGWDERFARLKPAMLTILHAVEDAFSRGDRRIDLAPGEQHYKTRFADGNDPVAWSILMLPGRRLPLTYARATPMLTTHRLRAAGKQALTAEQAERVRALRVRMRRAQ